MKFVSLLALTVSLVAHSGLFGSECEVSCCKTPTVVNFTEPQISQGLIKPGETARIVIRCAIDENGKLIGTKTISTTHPEIEKDVVAAVQNWTFNASMENGEALRATVNIPFKLTVAAK